MDIRTVQTVTRVLNVAASKGIAALPFADRPREAARRRSEHCRQPPAMLLDDILSRLQEKRT
jgi:hypothetical protein